MDTEKRLEAFLELLDTKRNAEELIKAVEEALSLVVDIKEATDAEREEIQKLRKDALATIEAKLAAVRDGIDGKDGSDGKDGRDGIDGKDGIGIDGQNGIDGKDGSPDTAEQIVTKLESLQDEGRLDASAIKGLEELIKRLAPATKGGSVYASQRGAVRAYDISASLNGVLKTFSLPAFWRIISVQSSSFPNAFRETVDWTSDASAMTITFTSEIDAAATLATGQTITIIYAEA